MFSKKTSRAVNNPVSKTLTCVVLAAFLFTISCTTTRVIKSQPDTVQSELKKGDVVKITTKEGRNFKLKIDEITSEAITGNILRGRSWQQIRFSEIAEIGIVRTKVNYKLMIPIAALLLIGLASKRSSASNKPSKKWSCPRGVVSPGCWGLACCK